MILNSFKIIQDIFDADFDNNDYFGEDEYQNYNDQIDYTQIYDEVTEVKIFYISLLIDKFSNNFVLNIDIY